MIRRDILTCGDCESSGDEGNRRLPNNEAAVRLRGIREECFEEDGFIRSISEEYVQEEVLAIQYCVIQRSISEGFRRQSFSKEGIFDCRQSLRRSPQWTPNKGFQAMVRTK
ncbi:hypothetical protein U1Q18_022422, partial [Sarracenia purpurea var. burkii]